MAGAFRAMLHPWMRPLFCRSLREADRPSAHKINKEGDKGPPYLRSHVGLNKSLSVPLCSTQYDTDCTHCIINLVRLSSNPSFCMISPWNFHSTRVMVLLSFYFRVLYGNTVILKNKNKINIRFKIIPKLHLDAGNANAGF